MKPTADHDHSYALPAEPTPRRHSIQPCGMQCSNPIYKHIVVPLSNRFVPEIDEPTDIRGEPTRKQQPRFCSRSTQTTSDWDSDDNVDPINCSTSSGQFGRDIRSTGIATARQPPAHTPGCQMNHPGSRNPAMICAHGKQVPMPMEHLTSVPVAAPSTSAGLGAAANGHLPHYHEAIPHTCIFRGDFHHYQHLITKDPQQLRCVGHVSQPAHTCNMRFRTPQNGKPIFRHTCTSRPKHP